MSSCTRSQGEEISPIRPVEKCGRNGKSGEARREIGNAEEEAEYIEGEEVDNGKREVVKMADPTLPSVAEVEEHNVTHLPFRNWCRHCIRGRGKEMPHKKGRQEVMIPEISMDFCFLGDEDGSKTMATMVARDRTTRMTLASAVPSKSTGTFIAKRIVAFMREIGCEQGDVIVKSDQEPAVQAIITAVGKTRAAAGGGRMVVEASPVGQSASNGIAERAIGSVGAQMRVIRSALQERWGVKLEGEHPIFTWMAEYAAVLLNRFEVGQDGKTSYERSRGKKAKMMGLEFGEGLLWKRKPVGGALGKLSCLWEDGIYLGIKATTGEIIIGTERGAWRTRTVQRKTIEDRWNK